MKRRFSQRARKNTVRQAFPILEILDERIPPGDIILGSLWAGGLLGSALPLASDEVAGVGTLPVTQSATRSLWGSDDKAADTSLLATGDFSSASLISDVHVPADPDAPREPRSATLSFALAPGDAADDPFNLFGEAAANQPRRASQEIDGSGEHSVGRAEASADLGSFHPHADSAHESMATEAVSGHHGGTGSYGSTSSQNLKTLEATSLAAAAAGGSAAPTSSQGPQVRSLPTAEPAPAPIPADKSSSGPSSPRGGTRYLETVVVDSRATTPVLSQTTLQNGVPYELVARGDVKVGTVDSIRGDAQYHDFIQRRLFSLDGTVGVGLRITGASLPASNAPWGQYHPTHIYQLVVTGQGQRVQLVYQDQASGYALHQGTLSVQIYQLPPPSAGHSPGGGFTDCAAVQNGGTGCPPLPAQVDEPPDDEEDDDPEDQGDDLITDNSNGVGDDGSDTCSCDPVRYGDGVQKNRSRDLQSRTLPHNRIDPRQTVIAREQTLLGQRIAAFGKSWGQTRSWSNSDISLPAYNRNFAGGGTIIAQMPYLIPADNPAPLFTGIIEVSNGTSLRWFDRTGTNPPVYTPHFFIQESLTYSATTHDYLLTDSTGQQLKFFDFSTTWATTRQGMLESLTDPYGTVTTTSWNTTSGDPDNGKLTKTTRSLPSGLTEVYSYSYLQSPDPNAGLLAKVVFGRSPTMSGTPETVRQTVYSYYTGVAGSFGPAGALQTATVQDATGATIDVSYNRYYTTATATSYVGGLEYVLNPASYARAASALGNPLTASDSALAPYADQYFEYSSDQRVTKETVQGIGASPDGRASITYAYYDNPAVPQPADDLFNFWFRRTTETMVADGTVRTVYTNRYAQPMMKITQTGGQQWLEYWKYDGQARKILHALPSAVSGVNPNLPALIDQTTAGDQGYLRDSAGLIEYRDYYTGTTTAGPTTGGPTAAGDVNGYLTTIRLKQGKAPPPPTGTGYPAVLQRSIKYFSHTSAAGVTIYPVANTTVYQGTDGSTGAETTSFTYNSWLNNGGETNRVASLTISRPIITTGQNGPGTADQETLLYDPYGHVTQRTDADLKVHQFQYDAATGARTQAVIDAGDSSHLNLITQLQVDVLGRTTKRVDPAGTVSYTVYLDANHEARTYVGWSVVDLVHLVASTTGPIVVAREDRTHSAGFTYQETATASTAPQARVDPSNPNNLVPTGGEPIPMADVQTLSRSYTSSGGQLLHQDDYFSFANMTNYPADTGTSGASGNYWSTQWAYDPRGRRSQTTRPTGTIEQVDFDGLSRPIDSKVGTSTSNLVMVAQYVYDQATAGGPGGVGDSNLTQVTRFPNDGSTNRIQQNFFDWRDRLTASKSGVIDNGSGELNGTHRPIYYVTYDNLNEATAVERYDGDGIAITSSGGVPQAPPVANRRARMTVQYDNQRRVYQVNTFSVDQSLGTLSASSLNHNVWYDRRGNVIKRSKPGVVVNKFQYDGAGRATKGFVTDEVASPSWTEAGSVASNNVLSQTELRYDGNSNVIFTIHKDRFHNESTLGELNSPTTAPLARVSYAAAYYDLADRLIETVNPGTNAGATYTRPASPPARDDNNPQLIMNYGYNAAGWRQDVTDPRGLVSRSLYDALGRVTTLIEAYTNGVPTNTNNRKTALTYDGDNHVLTYTALLPSSQQQTLYTYGVTVTGGSGVNSNELLATVTYPNQSAPQIESYSYNAQAEVVSFKDRNATTHTYIRDVLGRVTSDQAAVTSAQVDTSVLRLDTAYDTAGRPSLFTSYADTAGQMPKNQVQRSYNGLSQLTNEYQAHTGLVNISTTPQVQYAYDVMASGNESRLVSMTYPTTSRVLTYNYNGTTLDNSISRLTSISDATTPTLEGYSYLGLDTVVARKHPEANVDLTYIQQAGDVGTGDGGDQYRGLDRFGRVVDQRWIPTATPQSPTDRFQYTYDRDSNRLARTNAVNNNFNEQYSYDNFNQLTSFTRGTHMQTWQTLDPLGNWVQFNTDVGNQTRVNNTQNQITSLTGTGQFATLVSPTYDANGNTTQDENGTTYKFDAWNRLAQATPSGSTVTYGYDALNRRISAHVIQGLVESNRDLYYSKDWQVLEERTFGLLSAQYVWSPAYVDALVERDSGGQRLYVQQDANWNVTTLVDSTGAVKERYAYDPYGKPMYLDPTWATLATSAFAWIYLHQGGRLDSTSGLYNFRMRDYSPTLGRWMEQDPIRYGSKDSNLYGYVASAPTNAIDPSGLDRFWLLEPIQTLMDILNAPVFAPPFDQPIQPPKPPPTVPFWQGPLPPQQPPSFMGPWQWDVVYAGEAFVYFQGELVGRVPEGGLVPDTNTEVLIASMGTGWVFRGPPGFGGGLGAKGGVQANKKAGDAFRDEIADLMEKAGYDVEKEVVKNTPFGPRVIDVEVSKGGKVLGGLECKFGPTARYGPAQRAKDKYLQMVWDYIVNVVRDQ